MFNGALPAPRASRARDAIIEAGAARGEICVLLNGAEVVDVPVQFFHLPLGKLVGFLRRHVPGEPGGLLRERCGTTGSVGDHLDRREPERERRWSESSASGGHGALGKDKRRVYWKSARLTRTLIEV